MGVIHSYKDLIVWQKAMDLVILIYALTRDYPASELYGLTSQIKRSVVSIPSNIAEGRRRGTKNDYCQFLRIAFASGAELETQLTIARRLEFGKTQLYKPIESLLDEIMRMLNAMLTNIGNKNI